MSRTPFVCRCGSRDFVTPQRFTEDTEEELGFNRRFTIMCLNCRAKYRRNFMYVTNDDGQEYQDSFFEPLND